MSFGSRGRLGLIVPANNSVIEPEFWSVLPDGVATFATRILARGDLTPAAVRAMEAGVDAAVAQIAATDVDAIAYCDMVTTFIMEPGWNEARVAAIAAATGRPALSAWTALRDALAAVGARRIAVASPYPRAIHALAPTFFAARGFEVVADDTLDIHAMLDVPQVDAGTLAALVRPLVRAEPDAVVLLATDLPTFTALGPLERELDRPILSSNQTLLWAGLRAVGWRGAVPGLGRLFAAG